MNIYLDESKKKGSNEVEWKWLDDELLGFTIRQAEVSHLF